MAIFLLYLASEMRDQLISKKISKTVHSWLNKQTWYTTGNMRRPSTPCPAVAAGIFLRETSNNVHRGATAGRPPACSKMKVRLTG
jgi:hypothetical protein